MIWDTEVAAIKDNPEFLSLRINSEIEAGRKVVKKGIWFWKIKYET